MKVYVITEGIYSDYRIVGVSLDRKTADTVVGMLNREERYYNAEVEVYDTETIGDVYNGYMRYTVFQMPDGECVARFSDMDLDSDFNKPWKVQKIMRDRKNNPRLGVHVKAKSETDALKIASEVFREYAIREELGE